MTTESKSKTQNTYFVTVVDDRLDDSFQKSNRSAGKLFAIFAGFYICPLPVLLTFIFPRDRVITPILMIILLIASIIAYVTLCKKIFNKHENKSKKDAIKSYNIPLKEKEYEELVDILQRGGPVISSVCNGWIDKRSNFHKRQIVPMYDLLADREIKPYHLIRTKPDIVYLSSSNKKLLLKVFNLTDEYVIFFSKRDINLPAQFASRIKGISFTDKYGEKLYFCSGDYLNFYNFRILSLDSGKCALHIQENKPLPEQHDEYSDSDYEDFRKNGI